MNPLVFHLQLEGGFYTLDTSSNLCQIISNVVCSTSSANRYSLLSYTIPSFLNGGFQLCQYCYKTWWNTFSTVNGSTTSATMTSQGMHYCSQYLYYELHKVFSTCLLCDYIYPKFVLWSLQYLYILHLFLFQLKRWSFINKISTC